ncbi:MAG TPA: nucleoside hydrolase [Bryobacteraceae bacterium]|jgi:purine nucleosidase
MATKVLLIHDAAIDEYMSTVLLATMPNVELAGIVVVSADCIGGVAMQVAWKIQHFIGMPGVPLSLSGARGLNPFPWAYRGDCINQGQIAALERFGPNGHWPPYPNGDAFLRDFFNKLEGTVTVLCLCPITPLTDLLRAMPGAAAKIDHVIWMAGAINVAGNLDPTTIPPSVANPYAEWNVFWDPPAVKQFFDKTSFPITLFPLDITNSAKITPDFLNRLLIAGKQFRYADLARQSYALVGNEPFYDMWDVTATTYLARPDLYTAPQRMELAVGVSDDKPGAIYPKAGGRAVDVVLSFANLPGFYDYFIQQFSR